MWNLDGNRPQLIAFDNQSGNIWGDPLFVDPENGDFRISAGSPCVDAGDGTVAPETDYYGQPRMDVKGVKDAGKPDGDGVCPDIGIYEVPGSAAVPVPDLTVLSVVAPDEMKSGDTVTITYVVTNRGGIAVSGSIRDQVLFAGGGTEVAANDAIAGYSLSAFGTVEMSIQVKVPPLPSGSWRVGVSVNRHRDIFEQNLANNVGFMDDSVNVTMESMGAGVYGILVGAGDVVGYELSDMSAEGGYVRVIGNASAISFACGTGSMPAIGAGAQHILLPDGSMLMAVPPRKESEKAYIAIENAGVLDEPVSIEIAGTQLKVYGANPSSAVNSGEYAFVITGCGLNGDVSVSLGGQGARKVEVLGDMQIAATFDMSAVAVGSQSIAVGNADGESFTLEGAVNVQAASIGPKLEAWLETPSSVRDGRVFAGYVCYRNVGDEPMPMPCFKIASKVDSTRMGIEASESMTENELFVGGISSEYPAGILKPGDSGKLVFYFQPFGSYSFELTCVKETDDTAKFPAFGGVKAYLKAMGDAATRLNRRGKLSYDIHDFVDQALWEKQGIAHAAVSGRLLDGKSKMPVAGVSVSLVDISPESKSSPATATTDPDGYFQLMNLSDGNYRFVLDNGYKLSDASTNAVSVSGQTDINGLDVFAEQLGKISGVVLGRDGIPVGYGTVGVRIAEGDVVRTVLCDGLGGYSVEGLPDGVYEVQALGGDGYIADRVTNVVISAEDRSRSVVVELDLGGMVTGTVRSGGTTVTGGKVQAILANGDSYSATCTTNGAYAFTGLPEGAYAIRYYSADKMSDDVRIEVKAGKTETVDLSAGDRPLFFPLQSVGYGSLNTKFMFSDYARATNAISCAWDFNGDGVTDSTAVHPSWTFNVKGRHAVSVRILEKGGETVSTYVDCVEVRDAIETEFKENVIVVGGRNGGTLRVVEVSDGELVLSGDGGIALGKGVVIVCEDGNAAFARKVVSASGSSSRWTVKTENAEIADIYSRFAAAGVMSVDENAAMPVSLMSAGARKTAAAKKSDSSFTVFHDANMTFEPMFTLHAPVVDYAVEVTDNTVRMHVNYCMSFDLGMRVSFDGETGVEYSEEISFDALNSKVLRLGYGFMVYPDFSAGLSVSGALKGKGNITVNDTVNMRYGFKFVDNVMTWLPPYDEKEPNFSGGIDSIESGSLQGSLYFKPGLKISWLKTLLSAGVYGEVANTLTIDSGSEEDPPKADMTYSIKVVGEANLVDIDWGDKIKLFEHIDFKLHLVEPAETSLFSREILSMTGPKPDFSWSEDSSSAPATVSFRNKTRGTEVNWFGRRQTHAPTGWMWDINGVRYTEENPVVTFSEEGRYPVSLRAKGYLISGRNVKKATVTIGKPEDIPDDGESESFGSEGGQAAQSCDPNEVSGPLGVGEERYVKPGEWMYYTIFFENKEGFDIADAQEVKVTNPLNEWLDWSTFEVKEVAFNNHIDPGLNGVANGSHDKKLDGVDRYVRTTVSFDADSGIANWYMRIYDPNGMFGWPSDGSGFLPSNDETHRGEGYVSYRIKLRDDAPTGIVITNSATIVFDYNEPIETDPAWWNTVGVPGAGFGKSEISVEEGENITFMVSGGAEDKASSVKLYLTYNTAAAADIDLKNGAVDSSTGGSPVPNAQAARSTNLKFPLTLTWAAGEIGEKTITIPVLADKAVEADEFFTLQLASPMNMELGEDDVCTVTIHDISYDELKAKIDGGTATAKEVTQWNELHPGKVYVRPLAAPATGGKVAGGAYAVPGKTQSLKATALSGYVFAGWYTNAMCAAGQELVGYGDYRNPSLSYVAEEFNIDIFARFILVEEDYLLLSEGFLPSEITTNTQVSIYIPVESASLPDIKVSGLPSGLKFYSKDTVVKATKTTPGYVIPANTIYGVTPKKSLSKPATVTVTVKNAGKYAITRKYQLSVVDGEVVSTPAEIVFDAPEFYSVAADLSDDFAGKVTGMGVYQAGKKVTVKATANKGYVFNGWYYSGTAGSAVDENAQAARSTMGEELLTQAASYSFTMPETDVALYAKFVTAEEDAASIALSVDALGGEISPEAFLSVTNTCGVALKWSVAADALSQPVVAVSGLPSGLKFTAKDIMKTGSKTEVEIPANTIYGAPTAESKLDAKTGLRKPSVVKFTVTTAGKSKRVYPVDMTVLPLHDWAVGTFNGGGDFGQVSLTVAKSGKLSGKYLSEGLTWSLAADSFDSIDESGDVYRATLIGKSGKLVMTNEVGVACDSMGGFAESIDYIAYQNNWKLEPWKTIGKPFAMAAALEYEDSASVAGVEVPGVLNLKFAASGAVTVKGSFVTGINEKTGKEILYSASGAAVLAPQSEPDVNGAFDAVVFVYLPPKAGKFDGYVRCIGVRWTGEGWIKQ